MKKIIKTSILAFAMLFFCAVVSHAYTAVSDVVYGEKDSAGKVLVTVEFETNYQQDSEGFISDVEADGWTFNTTNMTKTYEVTNHLRIKEFSVSLDGNEEKSIIATPIQYQKNIEITPNSTSEDSNLEFVSSSNTSVATIENNKIKTKASGKTLISATYDGFYITFPLYVADSETPSDSDDEETPAGIDFSKAAIEITKYDINISNVEKSDKLYYKVDNKPTAADSQASTDGILYMSYNDSEGKYILSPTNLNELMQSPDDMYLHIYESESYNSYKKIKDIKLDKPVSTSINKFIGFTMATYNRTQIGLDLPYSLTEGRKLTYKIGKINDNDLLVSLKNGEADAFTKLLEYGRNQNDTVITTTVDTNASFGYATDTQIFEGSKLNNGDYYYLYAFISDEDGKYVPVESVTIAVAKTYPSIEGYPWYLFFYGSDDFNFDGITDPTVPDKKDQKQDDKKKPSILPKTGESALFIALAVGTVIIAVILHKKFRKTF